VSRRQPLVFCVRSLNTALERRQGIWFVNVIITVNRALSQWEVFLWKPLLLSFILLVGYFIPSYWRHSARLDATETALQSFVPSSAQLYFIQLSLPPSLVLLNLSRRSYNRIHAPYSPVWAHLHKTMHSTITISVPLTQLVLLHCIMHFILLHFFSHPLVWVPLHSNQWSWIRARSPWSRLAAFFSITCSSNICCVLSYFPKILSLLALFSFW